MIDIYTIGYTGRKPEQIYNIVHALGADLFDIRYSFTSRVPQWRQPALRALLGPSYRHVVNLGNLGYRTGRIELVNLDAGLASIERHQTQTGRPVILMCGCKDYLTCHRRVVALELVKRGWQAPVELTDHKVRSQCKTFQIGDYTFDLPKWYR